MTTPTIIGCTTCGIPYTDAEGTSNICQPCRRQERHSPHQRRIRLHNALHTHAGEPAHRVAFGGGRCPRFRQALRLIPDAPIYQEEPPAWQTPANRHRPHTRG